MSYAVRNTIILLVVLIALLGGGWSYIYFYQKPRLNKLETKTEKTRQKLAAQQQTADQYPILLNRYKKATAFFNNYNKALYPDDDVDHVYDFINSLNIGSAYTDFTFNFSDSTQKGQYGVMNMEIAGTGYYRNFINFIRQIELSKPLNKISAVSISPIDEVESYGKVNYNFSLKSFYDRVKLLGKPNLAITNNKLASVYNPFFPLIRSVKGNEDNLVDIGKSKLLAVSKNQIFIIDQKGVMQKLRRGSRVYLGSLSSINLSAGSATFTLNEGGIIDSVTMQINNEDEKENNKNEIQ